MWLRLFSIVEDFLGATSGCEMRSSYAISFIWSSRILPMVPCNFFQISNMPLTWSGPGFAPSLGLERSWLSGALTSCTVATGLRFYCSSLWSRWQ